ncbi:MAG: oxidoreductase, partial [Pseudomonadota bacterium]
MIQTPLTLPCGLTLKNRIAKAAMSEALADRRGDPSPALIDLYRRWGEGGAGLLVTGNTPVDPDHREHAANVVLDERTDLSAMARLAAAAKAGGAAVFAQLAHAGRQTPEALNPAPLSVSSIRTSLPGFGRPRAATADELEGVARRFARSAALAERAGFDGVEIHAAHGYLLSSSLSPRIND